MDFLWFLTQFRNPITNAIFQFFTFFGEQLLVIGVVCILFWCLDKKMAIRIGLSYFVAGLLVQAMKIIFCIPRPWILDSNFKPIGSALETATGYSFPSGHSQSAASLWGNMGLSAKKKAANIVCFLIALLTGFSRMFLGVHTPKDVAVGLLIGFLAAFFVCRDETEQLVEKHQSTICFAFGLIGVALLLFATCQIYFGNVEMEEGMDCCKSAGAGIGFALAWYIEETFLFWNPKEFFKNKSKIAMAVVFVLGIIVAVLLKSGLKYVLGTDVIGSTLRYVILVLWIVVLYPALLQWIECIGREKIIK